MNLIRTAGLFFAALPLLWPVSLYAAQVIPSGSDTVTLQTDYPGQSIFTVPLGNSITAGGAGIVGDDSQNWNVTNQGAIDVGANSPGGGMKLGSGTPAATVVNNSGSIISRSTQLNGPSGVQFTNGGQVYNHAGGYIEGPDGIHTDHGSLVVENAGSIYSHSGGGTAIYSGEGASVTNLAGGTIRSQNYGVSVNGYSRKAAIFNYGTIDTHDRAVYLYNGDLYAVYNAPEALITGGGGQTIRLGGNRGYLLNEGTIQATNTALYAENSNGGNVYVNAGVMTASNGYGIQTAASDNGNTIYNLGKLTGSSGSVLISGNDTRLVLGTTAYLPQVDRLVTGPGSMLSGDAVSTGQNNTVLLTDSGSEDHALTGFRSLTMDGVAWTLYHALQTADALFLENGRLTLPAGLSFSNPSGGAIIVRNNGALVLGNDASSRITPGNLDVHLRRDKSLAVISVGGGPLSLDGSVLRLRHSGLENDTGSWLLVDGPYSGLFTTPFLGTAVLTGGVRYVPGKVFLEVSYIVVPDLSGLSSLTPNARRAWPGFRDAFYNQRTPFMESLELAYSSPAEFLADLPDILNHAHPEGAISQGLYALGAHNAVAGTALGLAFPHDAGVASGNFAPVPFQTSFAGQGRQDLPGRLFGGGKYGRLFPDAGRMASLDGNGAYAPSSPGILAGWQPAADSTRRSVAAASSEFFPGLDEAPGYDSPLGVKLWAGYLGDFASQDGKGGYSGYDAYHNGFLIGGSLAATPHWTAGAYAGYTSGLTRYKSIGTRIDTDAVHLGTFARYRQSPKGSNGFMVTGDLGYSFTDNDSRRTTPTAMGDQKMRGDFDQNIYGGGLELAYTWSPAADPVTVITPFLAGRYAHLEQDGYTERGNLALKVGGTDADSAATTLGLAAARDIVVGDSVILTPKATAGWLHQWGDDTVSSNNAFVGSPVTFMTRSVKQDRDAALLGAGLDALVKQGNGWDVGLKLGYGADLRSSSRDQTVFAGFEVKF